MSKAIRIRTGFANVWLLRSGSLFLLFDFGIPGCEKTLFKKLSSLGVEPDRISLAVVSHVHFDHAGTLGAVKNSCNCKIIVHENEADNLSDGRWEIPDGITRFTKAASDLGKKHEDFLMEKTRFKAVRPDVIAGESLSLEEFGFDAEIISTPGHTEGSISLLTGDGKAFVGDLAYNELPFFFDHRRPPFANNPEKLRSSWDLLLEKGAKTIHPGHGAAFDADLLS